MNLLEQTQYLIKKTGLKPDRLKGQNFCVDEKVLADVVKTAEVSKNDTVLEVGAGFGFLTVKLAKAAGRVIAVEIDQDLIKVLRNLEKVYDNLEVVEGDILKISNFPSHGALYGVARNDFKVVANLPYSITSVFLRKFLTARPKPVSMTLLLQQEVAIRICAAAGQMSLLALSVQLYSEPKIVKLVSASSFWPKPRVDSAILHLGRIRDFPYAQEISEQHFWQVLRSSFCSKRKTLANNLASSLHLAKIEAETALKQAGLKPLVRAQELALADWLTLGKILLT